LQYIIGDKPANFRSASCEESLPIQKLERSRKGSGKHRKTQIAPQNESFDVGADLVKMLAKADAS